MLFQKKIQNIKGTNIKMKKECIDGILKALKIIKCIFKKQNINDVWNDVGIVQGNQ